MVVGNLGTYSPIIQPELLITRNLRHTKMSSLMNHLATSEVSGANQIGAPRDPLKSKSLIIKLHKCDDPNDDLKKTRKY